MFGKYWYSDPTDTPARSATALVLVLAYPRVASRSNPASRIAATVSRERDCPGALRGESRPEPAPAAGTRAPAAEPPARRSPPTPEDRLRFATIRLPSPPAPLPARMRVDKASDRSYSGSEAGGRQGRNR